MFLFNAADSQDVDLDAILGELCALERRCDGDIASTGPAPDSQRSGRPNSARITAGDSTDIGKNDGGESSGDVIDGIFGGDNLEKRLYWI